MVETYLELESLRKDGGWSKFHRLLSATGQYPPFFPHYVLVLPQEWAYHFVINEVMFLSRCFGTLMKSPGPCIMQFLTSTAEKQRRKHNFVFKNVFNDMLLGDWCGLHYCQNKLLIFSPASFISHNTHKHTSPWLTLITRRTGALFEWNRCKAQTLVAPNVQTIFCMFKCHLLAQDQTV